MIEQSLHNLINYIERENYKGWDPYDGLMSPLFKLPGLSKNKRLRFLGQQFFKRFPLSLRRLLFVPKGYNPVTLGLCIQGYSYMYALPNANKDILTAKISHLISELKTLIPSGYSGACWGYDFDWAARRASIPAYQPTIVATGIITNSLFECHRITGNTDALELCKSATRFVLLDINRTIEGDGICFSYSPFDKQQVYNASIKGARLLSQVYSITKEESLRSTAKQVVEYVASKQNSDGSWFYANNSTSRWIDNYHTGYILDCLSEYILCTGDNSYKDILAKGYKYYKENFFDLDFTPKFYSDKSKPIDCTAAGQSLLTLTRFADQELAKKVAEVTISEMQDKRGYFYFRKYKRYTTKTSFMRWSNAWMMAGLSYLLFNQNQN